MKNKLSPIQTVFATCLIGCLALWIGSCSQESAVAPQAIGSKVPVFPKPDLSNLGESIRAIMQQSHLRIEKLEASPERDIRTLAAAYGRLAMYYQSFGLLSQAQFCYQKAIELEPQIFQWQYLLARVLQAKFQHEDAQIQFQKALQIDEFHVPSLLALGEYARKAGATKEAKTFFNNALLLEKKCVFARLGLAQLAIASENFRQATALIEKALQFQPQGTQLHYTAAMAYRSLGNMEKAQFHLDLQKQYDEVTFIRDPLMEQVRKLAKHDRVFILRGDRAFKAGNFTTATKFYHDAVKLNPSFGESRLKLATSLLQIGELDRAKQEFEIADRLRPGNYQIAYNLAGIALGNGQIGEAKKQLKRAIEQHDDFSDAHLQLADIFLIENNYPLALDHYARVVALDPKNAAARVGRSLVLIHLNRHQDARQNLETDLVQFPSHASLGLLLVRLLAASPEDQVRDGKLAVRLVETMAQAGKTYDLLEAGAMAYAEAATFPRAISWQKEAIAIARKQNPDQVDKAETLLKTYKSGQPCRDPFPHS